MKTNKIFFALFLLCMGKFAIAQTPEQPQPVNTPTPVPPSLKKVASMEDNLIVSIGMANWLSVPSYVEVKTLQSRDFGVLLMGERTSASGTIGVGFGLGFSSQNVHTDAVLVDNSSTSSMEFALIANTIDYQLNKVSLNFLDAQLEFRLHSKLNKKQNRFKFSTGIKGGILLQSHSKQKVDDRTFKSSGIAGLTKYQYGPVVRIGYGNFAIGGYYSLVEIFREKKGPKLVPYSFGLYLTI